ncbi:hypothetical protein G6F57_002351 [Rhizopus arrhizus]|uniref:Metallo-beta-lactamase domain-containing protein n=1 Tax=Rhizopus oryzae TaxID=64495 RepID=A0A9P7BPW7_RHIOR|nr:hypothetical protein G6F23_003247 [Rhizopus arrhizus]KAG1415388.1 hypothetical protein G6F58_006504 [Rhizopus delemar]KAG0762910.1 hypothetical protein G6F24_006431 [Rhizopus arrhizus]KAG0789433.1 hypothetical protein G6F21_006514 [Rhizopus arrhizus]KAG0799387.1 hypothetical protein G6F22_003281 [Rhizopus arrhizus]
MFRRTAAALSVITLLPMSTAYAQGKKPHHDGNGFKNPWPSFTSYGLGSIARMFWTAESKRVFEEVKLMKPPQPVKMDWDLIKQGEEGVIKATWLGHACVLVQLNGFNILLDPIFSERCSPVQFAGPKRYTDVPCQLTDLPPIDAVVISHNHYDHLDEQTINKVSQLNPDCKFYVPLGNKKWFNLEKSVDRNGDQRVIELDWWDSSMLERHVDNQVISQVRLTCTPCQHFTGRGIFDRNKTLWASWCLEGMVDENTTKGKVFFGGDTGYRTVPLSATKDQQYDAKYLDTLPFCPAFKEIGEKFNGFDLALIPIGAYSPRWFMSPIHCSPEDAVRVHEDVKSKRSIGIHWGTFVLTDESIYEPPKRLEEAVKERGLKEEFDVLPLGGTFIVKLT